MSACPRRCSSSTLSGRPSQPARKRRPGRLCRVGRAAAVETAAQLANSSFGSAPQGAMIAGRDSARCHPARRDKAAGASGRRTMDDTRHSSARFAGWGVVFFHLERFADGRSARYRRPRRSRARTLRVDPRRRPLLTSPRRWTLGARPWRRCARAHARRHHRKAEKKCCKAKAGRKHDRRYLLTLWSPVTLNARPQQSICACHCGFATQGDG